jgi:SAM-dependent methyltransferase
MSDGSYAGWDDVDATGAADSFRSYLDTVAGRDRVWALKRRSRRLLDPASGDRLLDVGCGTGDDVAALADAVAPDGRALGVDASAAMVREARDRTSGGGVVGLAVADVGALPLADAVIDGCRADRVLQHVPDPRGAFAGLCRVVRPGGRVAVTDSDWGTLAVDPPGGDLADLTARIADPEWACARNPRVGRRLRRWAAGGELVDVDLDATTLLLTEFEAADEVLGLTGRVETMREAGALDPDAARRWLDALRAADADDSFCCSLALYTVAGTVPDGS